MAGTRVSLRFTRGGWVLLAVALLLAAGAFNAGLNLTYLLASLLIAVFAVAVTLPLWSLHGLRCRRAVARPPHAGEPFDVSLWLLSERRTTARLVAVEEPLAAGRAPDARPVRRVAFGIPPGGRIRLDCTLPPLPRGVHRLPGLRWSSRFPFGVAEFAFASEAEGELVVYPLRGRLREPLIAALRPRGVRMGVAAREGIPSEEFRSIREYAPGDHPRRIHWRATARMGKLCVRETERERNAPVLVLLDTRLPDAPPDAASTPGLEQAIGFAAELCRAAMAQGSGVTLIAFFPEPKALALLPGPGALDRLYEALARLTPSRDASPEALCAPALAAGAARALRVVAVTPARSGLHALRAVFPGVRMDLYAADSPEFKGVFTPAAREAAQ